MVIFSGAFRFILQKKDWQGDPLHQRGKNYHNAFFIRYIIIFSQSNTSRHVWFGCNKRTAQKNWCGSARHPLYLPDNLCSQDIQCGSPSTQWNSLLVQIHNAQSLENSPQLRYYHFPLGPADTLSLIAVLHWYMLPTGKSQILTKALAPEQCLKLNPLLCDKGRNLLKAAETIQRNKPTKAGLDSAAADARERPLRGPVPRQICSYAVPADSVLVGQCGYHSWLLLPVDSLRSHK